MRSRRGFSLVETLVVALGMGTLTLGLTSVLVQGQKKEGRLSEDMDKESLRRWFRLAMDCEQTMTNNVGACTTSPVAVYNAGGGQLIQVPSGGTYTTRGNFEFQSSCTGNAKKNFTVEIRKRGTTAWEPLFPVSIPRACREPTGSAHGNLLVMGYYGTDTYFVKIKPNGQADTSYGTGGVYQLPNPPFNGGGYIQKLHLLPDKSILLIGSGFFGKLLPDGTLDTSYGTGGKKVINPSAAGVNTLGIAVTSSRVYRAITTGVNNACLGLMAHDHAGNAVSTFGSGGSRLFREDPFGYSAATTTGSPCTASTPRLRTGVRFFTMLYYMRADESAAKLYLGGVLVGVTTPATVQGIAGYMGGMSALIRFNASNGALDTTFNSSSPHPGFIRAVGAGINGFGSGGYFGNSWVSPYFRPDGKIFFASPSISSPVFYSTAWGGISYTGNFSQLHNADGTLDTSWGSTTFTLAYPPIGSTPQTITFPGLKTELDTHCSTNGMGVSYGGTNTSGLERLSTGKFLDFFWGVRCNSDFTHDSTYSYQKPVTFNLHMPVVLTSNDHVIASVYPPNGACQFVRYRPTDGSVDPTWTTSNLGCGTPVFGLELPP